MKTKNLCKNIKRALLVTALTVATIFQLMPVHVQASGMSSTPNKAMIDVRVKADVPEGFSDSVTMNYVGKETEGFTVILTPEEEYSTIISIPRDIYTFKSQNVSDGYTIKASKNFTLESAELNTVYLLPIIVTESTSITNESNSYVNVKIVAEPQYEAELNGTYDITYSGTGGNSFVASLCAENDYMVEMPISKDLYTMKSLIVSEDYADAYVLDSLYSFNTIDANEAEKYLLSIKVFNKEDAPVPEEKEEEIVKEICVRAELPEKVDFNGTISATYTSDKGDSFEAILNESNNYKQNLYVDAGMYALSYAVSYDTKVYSFSGQPTFSVTESTDFLEVPIYIMKDGVVLTDELLEQQEATPEPTIAPVQEEKQTPVVGIIILLLIVAVIGFVVFKTFISKKNSDSQDDDDDDDTDDIDDGEGLDDSDSSDSDKDEDSNDEDLGNIE